MRVGARAFFAGCRASRSRRSSTRVSAATELARHRIGALIAFEQERLDEFVVGQGTPDRRGGAPRVSPRQLFFHPRRRSTQAHDAVVVIQQPAGAAKAGVFFLMPDTKVHDKVDGIRGTGGGARHHRGDRRGGRGIRERGAGSSISFCFQQQHRPRTRSGRRSARRCRSALFRPERAERWQPRSGSKSHGHRRPDGDGESFRISPLHRRFPAARGSSCSVLARASRRRRGPFSAPPQPPLRGLLP